MDDDVVSLIGLAVLLNEGRAPSCFREHITMTQLTLFLYLLVKCRTRVRLDLKHVTDTLSSLAVTLDWITVAKEKISADESVDHIILNLAERTTVIYFTDRIDGNQLTGRKEEPSLELGFEFQLMNGVPQIVPYVCMSLEQKLTNEISSYKEYTIANNTLR